VNREDRELAARIVDPVERGIRRAGLLSGPEAGREARRRFDAACPWLAEINTERRRLYDRETERAMARLYSPGATAGAVECGAGLSVPAELGAWLEARGVELRERVVKPAPGPGPDPSGAEQVTLDTTGGGG